MRAALLALSVQLVLVAVTARGTESAVNVPEGAAKLVRPILDLQQQWIECHATPDLPGCNFDRQNARQGQIGKLLYALTKNRSRAADEALVVLTCFYIGESQEEADAILARGRRMIKLLSKYRKGKPAIPQRMYPDSMLREDRQSNLEGLIQAIQQGWHSTSDAPGE